MVPVLYIFFTNLKRTNMNMKHLYLLPFSCFNLFLARLLEMRAPFGTPFCEKNYYVYLMPALPNTHSLSHTHTFRNSSNFVSASTCWNHMNRRQTFHSLGILKYQLNRFRDCSLHFHLAKANENAVKCRKITMKCIANNYLNCTPWK